MMINQDDLYGPCSSPSSIMKSDPLLADVSSSPDIDDSFLSSLSEGGEKEWLQDGLPISSDAKQTLTSNCYVDGEASVQLSSQLLNAETPHLAEKPITYNGKYCFVEPCRLRNNVCNSKEGNKRSIAFNPTVSADELNSSLLMKQAKRGRPMKITSRSKQALYAREYRRKNKIALWNYEKRVEEQNQEIAELMKQNAEMKKNLAEMTRQFNLMRRLISTSPSIALQFQELSGSSVDKLQGCFDGLFDQTDTKNI